MINSLTGDDRPGRSKEGIEIWNRDWETVKARLFPEDVRHLSKWNIAGKLEHMMRWRTFEYWKIPASTKFDPDSHDYNLIQVEQPIIGIKDMFFEGANVIEIGCGRGAAAQGMAQEMPKLNFTAVDYELGGAIELPKHGYQNLKFQYEDWRDFSFEDDTFDVMISDQGVAMYGNTDIAVSELTRVAKIGALFRGTQDTTGIYGRASFSDRLAEKGWDVWQLRGKSGRATGIIIAQLKHKERDVVKSS